MYDTIIIGGGPGGLSAAVYAGRYLLKTLVLSKDFGGTMMKIHKIENYPGYKSITGYELSKAFEEHAKEAGAEIKTEEVIGICKKGETFEVETTEKKYESKTVVLSTGMEKRKLNIPGEKEFLGKGVSYCATCDGAFFRDKVVGVVGGNDSAAKEALLLSEYAKKVYIIYRKEKIRAEPVITKKVEENPKIEVINNTNIVEVKGDKVVNKVVFDNGKEFDLDGLFIEIGGVPGSSMAECLEIKLNEKKEIVINEFSETNVPGIYAAGDITNFPWKQIIIAASQGSVAAFSAYKHIKTQ